MLAAVPGRFEPGKIVLGMLSSHLCAMREDDVQRPHQTPILHLRFPISGLQPSCQAGDSYCWCMSIGFAWRCSSVLQAMQLCFIPRISNQGVTPWLGVSRCCYSGPLPCCTVMAPDPFLASLARSARSSAPCTVGKPEAPRALTEVVPQPPPGPSRQWQPPAAVAAAMAFSMTAPQPPRRRTLSAPQPGA